MFEIKTSAARHEWAVVGRCAREWPSGAEVVRCQRCGETRATFAGIQESSMGWGCLRRSRDQRFAPGDLVIPSSRDEGQRVHEFRSYAQSGMAATTRDDGMPVQRRVAELRPYV